MTHLIFLGPPGAGKGTQAKKLAQQYGWTHISTGDLFRSAYAQRTPLGIKAHDEYWGKGNLVPDEVTNELAFERLQKPDCAAGFILDGYPRTVGQAEALQGFLASEKKSIDLVIQLACDENALVERIASRLTCRGCNAMYGKEAPPKTAGQCDGCAGELYQRSDDNEIVVRARFKEYALKTAPLVDFYKKTEGLVVDVDGLRSVEEVFEEIERVVDRA